MTLSFPAQLIHPPKLNTTRDQKDPTVVCYFYEKEGKGEWYVIEAEEKNDNYIFYGYIVNDTKKMGEFTLEELEARKTIERSLLFKPCPLSYIKVSSDE